MKMGMMSKSGLAAMVLIFVLLHDVMAAESARSTEIKVPVDSVTIYGNDMAFVKRGTAVDLDKGILEIRVLNLTKPILDSLFIYDSKGSLFDWYHHVKTERVREYVEKTLSFDEILKNSVGSEIEVNTYSNRSLQGELTWVGAGRIGILGDDGVLFINRRDIRDIFIYGAETRETKEINKTISIPELVFKERSEKGRHDIKISYLTWGANWKVDYKFYTDSDEKTGKGTLQAWSIISNQVGEDWDDVRMKLVVGYPLVLYPRAIPTPIRRDYVYKAMAMEAEAALAAPTVEERFVSESIGEYCVYELMDRVTLKKGETRYFPIFSKEVEFRKRYLWDTSNGEVTYKIYEIENTLENPWAEGIFSVYVKGNFQGQDRIRYTAKKDRAEVKTTKAPDVVVKKTILETETFPEYAETYRGKTRYARTTYYKVNLTVENHRDEGIDLRIRDHMTSGHRVELKSSTITPRRILNTLIWDITMPKGDKKTIIYDYEVTNWRYL
ncbi:MAG TPA: DUF4139 domain-containing protein [Candidatus Altiarchaeales archaeon]|nr:DUF4139 domain-containing protein [Candidatus Altiarchaeales archaeon]